MKLKYLFPIAEILIWLIISLCAIADNSIPTIIFGFGFLLMAFYMLNEMKGDD